MTPDPTLSYARAESRPPSSWLHRFAVLLTGMTLLLIVAGGMVTSTGSGLAVPDWPTTYGQNMFTFPTSKWVGGIFYEHGHRLIASSVGFLTIILAIWLQLREPRRWLRRLGWLALFMVVAQGVLGGITVLYLLPTPVSVFHGCLAQIFFCMVLTIAVYTSSWWRSASRMESPGRVSITKVAFVLTGVVFLQLILGAVMRHTESGLAIPDFPLSYGQVVPGFAAADVERYNDDRRWTWQLPQIETAQLAIHFAHRVGAVIVSVSLIAVCVIVLARHGRATAMRRPAVLLLVLLAVQIGLGAWTIWSQKAPIAATAHVAVGAATLGTCWFLTLAALRLLRFVPRSPIPAAAWAGGSA